MMHLTKENKAKIDAMPYESLLAHWRFAPVGDPWLGGETGQYWRKRMSDKGGYMTKQQAQEKLKALETLYGCMVDTYDDRKYEHVVYLLQLIADILVDMLPAEDEIAIPGGDDEYDS